MLFSKIDKFKKDLFSIFNEVALVDICHTAYLVSCQWHIHYGFSETKE